MDNQNIKAPWPDFVGQSIHEGDTICHPSGETGTVVFLVAENEPGDQWRVDYGTGILSRLCLQVGDKGQAVVVHTERQSCSVEATVSCEMTMLEVFLLERLLREYICEQIDYGASGHLEKQEALLEKLQSLKRAVKEIEK